MFGVRGADGRNARDNATVSLSTRLGRITTSGRFIPQIDGLRFIAIFAVVFFHIASSMTVRDERWGRHSLLRDAVSTGHFGVQIFFVISGFILASPFARHALLGAKAVSLKAYFLRRVTRLEPPYVVAMVGLFLVALYRGGSAGYYGPHLLTGITYSNSLVYGAMNPLNLVTWSLEVEIQFYLVVPLLTRVFLVRPAALRRCLLAAGVLVFTAVAHAAEVNQWPRVQLSLLSSLQWFLVGFLLADLHLSGALDRKLARWDLVSLAGWPTIVWLVYRLDDTSRFSWPAAIALIAVVLLVFVAALRGPVSGRVLSIPVVTVLGGACYSIYLLHWQVEDYFSYKVVGLTPFGVPSLDLLTVLVVVAVPVIVVGMSFYLMIERPCMQPNWWREDPVRRVLSMLSWRAKV